MVMRGLQMRSEYALVRTLLALARGLGPARASDLGGRLARALGPMLPVSRIAEANLAAALPELDEAARARIVRGVWENLGRTVAEFPHLPRLHATSAGPGWEFCGAENVPPHGPLIYVSAHFGNWELLPRVAAANGIGFATLYRAAANPLVDRAIQELRGAVAGTLLPAFAKGAPGALAAAAYVARGGRIGVMADQKANEGIAVEFFGRPAMTTPLPAALALRLRCPIIPARVERIGPARLRVTAEAALVPQASGDRGADIRALTLAVNRTIERWVRAQPEAWLWLHRRWPREAAPATMPDKVPA